MFAQRLKVLRKRFEITQPQFATSFNISNGTVGMWEIEKRQPDFDTVQKIAEFFCVSTDYLLGHTDNPNSSNMLGAYVRFRRGKHSLEEFAEQIKMSPILLGDIEQGFKGSKDWADKAKRQTCVGNNDLDTLAKGLNVDFNYLACLTSNVNPYMVINATPPADDIFIMLKPVSENEEQGNQKQQFRLAPTNLQHFGGSDSTFNDLRSIYEKLNIEGRQRILNYAKDLAQISTYTDELPVAAQVAGDVTHTFSEKAKDEIRALEDVTDKL